MFKLIYYSFVFVIFNLIATSASASLTAVVLPSATSTSSSSTTSSPLNNEYFNDINHYAIDQVLIRLSKKKTLSLSNSNSSIINQNKYNNNVNIYTLKRNFKLSTADRESNQLNTMLDCKATNDLKFTSLTSPTIVKGLAVEKFKYYSTQNNKLKSYSVLFKIEYVYKLNNQLISDYTNGNYLFSRPLIQQHSNLNNTNMFILVENFKSDDFNRNSKLNITDEKKNCYSIDIKLDRSYYLYLNNSTQIKQNYFNHPVRFKHTTSSSSSNQGMKSTILMLSIPIFNLTGQPIDTQRLKEIQFRHSLCMNCSQVRVKFEKKIKHVHLRQNVRLICQLESDQHTIVNVLWKKNSNSNSSIKNSTKFTIETNKKYSILNIKSVNYTDQGYYYCAVRDHSSLDTNRFITDKIKLVVQEPNKSINGPTLAYTRITSFYKILTSPNHTTKLTTLAASKLNRLSSVNLTQTGKLYSTSSEKTTPTTSTQKLTTLFNELYVECDEDENICWNDGTCYKTNPYLTQPDIIHKKFCICKEFYEPPHCEIESRPYNVEFDQEEAINDIPDDLKDLWNSLGFSRSVNQINSKRNINNPLETSSSSSSESTTPILYQYRKINDYLYKKKKLFYRNNHI